MKAPERDNLLIRLDERVASIIRELKDQSKHQVEQNGYIKETIEKTARNSTWITAFKWIVSITIPAIILLVTHLYGVW